MAELKAKMWLNWEVFEIASIPSLCMSNVSFERIQKFASNFDDVTCPLTINDWKNVSSSVFQLSANHIQALYSILSCITADDPHDSIQMARLYAAEGFCMPSSDLRVTDMLCYLFALLVKKKFRGVAEVSNMEAFPSKPTQKLSPLNSKMSASDTKVTRVMVKTPNFSYQETTQLQIMLRYFLKEFPRFLNMYAPHGLTKTHVKSLSLLIVSGPNYSYRYKDLADALNLFQKCEVEQVAQFSHLIHYGLFNVNSDLSSRDITNNSPLSYRPILQRKNYTPVCDMDVSEDKPILIINKSSHYELVEAKPGSDVFIHNCINTTIYICGSVSCVFISHCKDSVIFVGAATAIHMDYGLNNKVIAASKLFHIDTSTRCTSYLLTNTKPLLTGNCSHLTLAPYNAVYSKFGLDILIAGINPKYNYWDNPIIIGGLFESLYEKISPEQFMLFCVPFHWDDTVPVINPIIPPEYLRSLEAKRNQILTLKSNLDKIKGNDPILYDKIVHEFKTRSNKLVENEGVMQQTNWLFSLSQYQ